MIKKQRAVPQSQIAHSTVPVGAGNAAYVPLGLYASSNWAACGNDGAGWRNLLAATFNIMYALVGVPLSVGIYHLYCKQVRVHVQTAAGTDYVNDVYIYGNTQSTAVDIRHSHDNLTSAATYYYNLTSDPTDMSAYVGMSVLLAVVCANANALVIYGVDALVYYDT